MTIPTKRQRFIGCLLGLAIGDALGAPVEFQARGTFPKVRGMRSGGTHNLKAGQWTDDTSMALCLADSLIECGFDPADQMNRYVNWWQDGYNSCDGIGCFDIGNGTRLALQQYCQTRNPISGAYDSAGNGALMRLAPLAMYYCGNAELAMSQAAVMTATTHGAEEAIDCSRLLAGLLSSTLENGSKYDSSKLNFASIRRMPYEQHTFVPASDINSGGYCIDSLRAALWSIANAYTFKDAVLQAVNLGDDADTVGAITGAIAGAQCGVDGIPPAWIKQLSGSERIIKTAERLYDINVNS